MDRNSRFIDLVIRAKNMFSTESEVVKTDIRQLTEEQARLNREIDKDEQRLALISDYRRLKPAIEETRQELLAATNAFKAQNDQIRISNNVTDEQRANLERLRLNQADLRKEYNAQVNELRKVNTGLRQTRVSINDLDGAVDRAKLSIQEKNVSLGRLQVELKKAGADAAVTATRMDRLKRSITANIIVMNRLRSGVLSVAVAFGALVGLDRLARLFGDVERGMVAVSKVTTLTRDEIQFLTDDLEELSQTVSGSTLPELLKFAEAGGRLGIDGTENLLEFTRVMDQLAVSTNLAGEEGADSFGRLINAVGAGRDEYQSLASQLVAVGNNTATNEALIARFATRLGNSTKEAEFNNQTIIALAGSMAELGIQAESGGTQIGRVTRDLRTFAEQGGAELDILVDVIGKTREEIQELGRSSPDVLLADFLAGLNNVSTGAGEATQTLIALGLNNERILQTIPPLALNYEKFAENLRLASDEQEHATALLDEAAKAYAAQNTVVQVFTNTVRSAGVELGRAFSNEYKDTLEDLGDTVRTQDGTFSQMGQTVGSIVRALSSATINILEFLKASSLTTRIDTIFKILGASIQVVSISIGGLAQLFALASLALNNFTGNVEGVARAEETLDRITQRNKDSLNELIDTTKEFAGISTASFNDLQNAAEQNSEAVERLTDVDQALLEQLLLSNGGIEKHRDLYVQLTNEINKNAREIDIRNQLEKETVNTLLETENTLRSVGVSQELRNKLIQDEIDRTVISIDNQSDLNIARRAANDLIGETVVSTDALIEKLQESNLSEAERLETIQLLHAARVLELEDIAELTSATDSDTNSKDENTRAITQQERALSSLASAHEDEIRNVIELRQRREELVTATNNAEGATEGYLTEVQRLDGIISDVIRSTGLEIDEFDNLIPVLEDADDKTEKLKDSNLSLEDSIKLVTDATAEYVDNLLANTKGAEDAEESLEALKQKVEENNKAWNDGTISLTEYNAINSELESGISQLEGVVSTATSSINNLATANQRAVESNERVATSNRSVADSYREVKAQADSAADSVSNYTRELNERNQAVSDRFDQLTDRGNSLGGGFGEGSFNSSTEGFSSFSVQTSAPTERKDDDTDDGFSVSTTGDRGQNFRKEDVEETVTEIVDPVAERLEAFVKNIVDNTSGLNLLGQTRTLENEIVKVNNAFRNGQIDIERRNEFLRIIESGLSNFTDAINDREQAEKEQREQSLEQRQRLIERSAEIREQNAENRAAVRTIRLQIESRENEETIDIPVYDDEQERAIETLADRLEDTLR